ncbi:MAG: hypothetical protein HZA35_00400 [Parcubacteria group bacterium]|nr:hypothetical protein [Parcubacteria group bacterium]
MQVHIVFHDGRPIPLITQEALSMLIAGVRNEMKKNEQEIKILQPWMYRFERARKIYDIFRRIIRTILNTRDVGIVMICGDTYGSFMSLMGLIVDGEVVRNRYAPIPLPYVQQRNARIDFSKGVMKQEWDNLEAMMLPGRPLFHVKKERIENKDSMYSWGSVRTDLVMQPQACFFDTPVLSSTILRDLFRWMWSTLPQESGPIIKPILCVEGCTLRDEHGELPLRWRPKPYVFQNATANESLFSDPYYYEAHLLRLLDRLRHYRCSFERMHIYHASQVKNALKEATFFSQLEALSREYFSCKHLEYHEIDSKS